MDFVRVLVNGQTNIDPKSKPTSSETRHKLIFSAPIGLGIDVSLTMMLLGRKQQ